MAVTEGPFKIVPNPIELNAAIHGKGGGCVAVVWSGRKPSMQTVMDNAALFAAAPALLDALQKLLALCEEHPAFQKQSNVITADRVKAARKAIAMAKAEEGRHG